MGFYECDNELSSYTIGENF